MKELLTNQTGHYEFLPAGDVYSHGIRTISGYGVVRAVLATPVSLENSFSWITVYLASLGRPLAALCGVELHIPEPLTFAAFAAMNEYYTILLHEHDLLLQGHNPITRTTIAPAVSAPPAPSLHAFTFTVPTHISRPGFVTAGNGELQSKSDGSNLIISKGDLSTSGMGKKASYVLNELARTIQLLGASWRELTDLTVYTTSDWKPILQEQLLPFAGSSALHSLRWVYSTPPLEDMDFEVDVRRVFNEWRLD